VRRAVTSADSGGRYSRPACTADDLCTRAGHGGDEPGRAPLATPPIMSTQTGSGTVRLGIGGPVGSGKTALVDALCKRMREHYELGVVTNDIFTREDMEFLVGGEGLS